jgi:hypothetical protein
MQACRIATQHWEQPLVQYQLGSINYIDAIGTKLCAKVARWVRAIRNIYVIEKIRCKIKSFKSMTIHYLTWFMHRHSLCTLT